jgi:hypothetical protein
VDFATAGGAPDYRASGIIYGMSPNGSLPQDHFFRDIKWHYMRAGGAQLNNGGYATNNFVTQLIGDVRANNMTVQWDLWNEPDGINFWGASRTQYLQMWSRFHARVRASFPNQFIVGPSLASRPNASNATSDGPTRRSPQRG